MTLIIGHRGAKAKPENTLAAFRYALESEADGIELDAYLSKDDQLIVIHDSDLEKISQGADMVRQTTVEELLAFRTRSAEGQLVPRLQVTLLKDVLDMAYTFRKHRPLIEIEVKNEDTRVAFLKLLAKYIQWEMVLPDTVVLSSPNMELLRRTKQEAPQLRVSLIIEKAPSEPELRQIIAFKPFAVAMLAQYVREDMIRELNWRGVKLFAWMDPEPPPEQNLAYIRKLWRWNLAGFITSYPLELKKLLASEGITSNGNSNSSSSSWNIKSTDGQEKMRQAIDKTLGTGKLNKWTDGFGGQS